MLNLTSSRIFRSRMYLFNSILSNVIQTIVKAATPEEPTNTDCVQARYFATSAFLPQNPAIRFLPCVVPSKKIFVAYKYR